MVGEFIQEQLISWYAWRIIRCLDFIGSRNGVSLKRLDLLLPGEIHQGDFEMFFP
jgi:hypothetical protein